MLGRLIEDLYINTYCKNAVKAVSYTNSSKTQRSNRICEQTVTLNIPKI